MNKRKNIKPNINFGVAESDKNRIILFRLVIMGFQSVAELLFFQISLLVVIVVT